MADLYFIGLQEVDLSAEAFLLNDSSREEYWQTLIGDTLDSSGVEFVKVASKQLAGILLIAFCRKSVQPHVTDISMDSKGCGVLGFGNKGGVAIRLHVFSSSLCVVNSHLAADTNMVERRNADFEEICRNISFPPNARTPLGDPRSGPMGIWDSDILLWIGDLNYRVALPEFQVKEMLKSDSYVQILKYDQLSKERQFAGGAFHDFDEPRIAFPPSYKYDPGTSRFDTSEKKRAPSWTDRVLYRQDDPVEPVRYESIMDIKTSDHKPVLCTFNATVTEIDSKKYQSVYQSVLRDMDKLENDAIPNCKVDTNALDFGQVRYLQPVSRDVVLENVGSVAAKVRFIPKLEETTICRSWMWINPPMSVVMPGDKLTIRFTIVVDDTAAPSLNIGASTLDDILILHLENGKDFFFSVGGTFVPTCFAMDLDFLVRLQRPVALIQDQIPTLYREAMAEKSALTDRQIANNPREGGGSSVQRVPKEIWRVIDFIYRFGIGLDGIFMMSGDQTMMAGIRNCLDTGDDFRFPAEQRKSSVSSAAASDSNSAGSSSSGSNHLSRGHDEMYIYSMGEVLLRFLESLSEPVVPFGTMYTRCIDASHSYQLSRQVVKELPTTHYNLFVYITSFLREVIEVAPQSSQMTAETLAALFSAVMLRTPKPVKQKYHDTVSKKKTAFLLHFLDRGSGRQSS